MLRVERHRLGPRVYLYGLRIHEFALGFGVLAGLLVGGSTELWDLTRRTGVAVFSCACGATQVRYDTKGSSPSGWSTAADGSDRCPHCASSDRTPKPGRSSPESQLAIESRPARP